MYSLPLQVWTPLKSFKHSSKNLNRRNIQNPLHLSKAPLLFIHTTDSFCLFNGCNFASAAADKSDIFCIGKPHRHWQAGL